MIIELAIVFCIGFALGHQYTLKTEGLGTEAPLGYNESIPPPQPGGTP